MSVVEIVSADTHTPTTSLTFPPSHPSPFSSPPTHSTSPAPSVCAWLQDKRTPLHQAAGYGRTEAARELVKAGATVDALSTVSGELRGVARSHAAAVAALGAVEGL